MLPTDIQLKRLISYDVSNTGTHGYISWYT